MMKIRTILYIGTITALLMGCSEVQDLIDNDEASPVADVIRVGGISLGDELEASVSMTRANSADADTVDWLLNPLFAGLDITYGKSNANKRIAVLKLLKDITADTIKRSGEGLAEYSFNYRDNGQQAAIWYDNGAHFFEGVYVPEKIKYTGSDVSEVYNSSTGKAKGLNTDQHDDETAESSIGNYTLLSHYLGMPSNFKLNATVERIKLPFRHRLARVLAYILIDPVLGDTTTIEGYDITSGKDDPTSTKIKFCNVKVLEGVKDTEDSSTGHHTYTPQWGEARKAIPHFVGERGSFDDSNNTSYDDEHFIAYYDTKKKEYYYPTDAMWSTINQLSFDSNNKSGIYERTRYGKVPVYDLIVRPTYTTSDRVMYDEVGENATASHSNKIDFEVTLSNGLHYTKEFVFDLDANYETVVYLHISRERVDYNSSGSVLWQETRSDDDWYGVNNENGNNLSFAGSGWQRAYTYGATSEAPSSFTDKVTDGHQYTSDDEDVDDQYAQYVTNEKWIEMLREAHEGGTHHGDYFILHKDISIPAAAFPDDFVFTGHLDGQGHTITITDGTYVKKTHAPSYDAYDNASGIEPKYVEVSEGVYRKVKSSDGPYYERTVKMAVNVGDRDTITYAVIPNIIAYTRDSAYMYTGGVSNNPVSQEDDDYKRYDFYKRVVTVTTQTLSAKTGSYYLFAGLNGCYATAQESNPSATWEANVHKEGSHWVPFKTDTDGWRAEIINTNFAISTGSTVFRPQTESQDTAVITGYLHNCYQNSVKLTDNIPSIPEY